MSEQQPRRAYNFKQFAALYGISERTVWNHVKNGRLRATNFCGRNVIFEEDREAFEKTQRQVFHTREPSGRAKALVAKAVSTLQAEDLA